MLRVGDIWYIFAFMMNRNALWPLCFVLGFAGLLLVSCHKEEQRLSAEGVLSGYTFAVKSYLHLSSGVWKVPFDGAFVAFSADSVRFFTRIPKVHFSLSDPSDSYQEGWEERTVLHDAVIYRNENVVFGGEKYKIIPQNDENLLLFGSGKALLQRTVLSDEDCSH